mmetsp:Transcript_77756/g.227953  ORF Transcript_77756/g.227953 Transcript_77756/m.227953 type:complete len:382 (-) Transcript_77756:20-1165(-)
MASCWSLWGEDDRPCTVGLLHIRVPHKVVLVDDAARPQVVAVSRVQDHVGLEPPLARLPGHEVVHGLIQRRGQREQPLGRLGGDDVGHRGVHVLGLPDRLALVLLLALVEVAAPPACPAEVQHIEVRRRLAHGQAQALPEEVAVEHAELRLRALEAELHVVLEHQCRRIALGGNLPDPAVRVSTAALAPRHRLDLPRIAEPLGEDELHPPRLSRRLLRQGTGTVVLRVRLEAPLLVVLGRHLLRPPPVSAVELRPGRVVDPLVVVAGVVGVAARVPRSAHLLLRDAHHAAVRREEALVLQPRRLLLQHGLTPGPAVRPALEADHVGLEAFQLVCLGAPLVAGGPAQDLTRGARPLARGLAGDHCARVGLAAAHAQRDCLWR